MCPPRWRVPQKAEQLAHGALAAERIAKRQVVLDQVAIAPPIALLDHIARLRQLEHDPIGGPLGHAHAVGYLA